MSVWQLPGVSARVLRCEGPRAIYERIVDRLVEARRRSAFAEVPLEAQSPAPILNVAAATLGAQRGGISLQIGWRRTEETKSRRFALLFPAAECLRLEVTEGKHGVVSRVACDWRPSPVEIRSRSFERKLEEVASVLGASVIHVEGTAGLPLESLIESAKCRTVLLSIHDFSLFCPRPHLMERPVDLFCHYCSDNDRCQRCLGVDWMVDEDYQLERRRLAARLLENATATIWPSRFLLDRHRVLFPGTWRDRARLIEPPCPKPEIPGDEKPRRRKGPKVAFLGGPRVDKGARLFAEVVRRLESSTLRFAVYGGLGDEEICRELRRLPGVEVCGYYRAGSLPRRLRADGIDAALLLSMVPETFSLALSECVIASIPVIALARGALTDRVPSWRGTLLSPETAVDSLIEILKRIECGGAERVLTGPGDLAVPSPAEAAQAHLALYRKLGVEVRLAR